MKQYPKRAITVSALFVAIWSLFPFSALAWNTVFAGKIFRLAILVVLLLVGDAQAKEGQTPLLLNGQPYFPVGVAGAPLDLLGTAPDGGIDFWKMFTEMKYAGMNTFVPVFLTSEEHETSHDAIYEFLPYGCHKRDSKIRSGVGALRYHRLSVILPAWTEVEEASDILLDRPFDETRAAQALEALNDCYTGVPLLGYQTYDDAPIYGGRGIPLEKMEQFNRLAKQTSPAFKPHVFAVYPTEQEVDSLTGGTAPGTVALLQTNIASYTTADAADNIGVYSYPIPGRSPAAVGEAVDYIWQFRSSTQRPIVGLQGFGWKDLTRLSNERRPTAQETYFMAFQAIVRGAGGVVWWGANFIESSSALWKGIKRATWIIDAVKAWLVQPDSELAVQAPGCEALLKNPVNGRYLLIVVNPQPSGRFAQIALTMPKPYATIRHLFSGRSPFTTEGHFSYWLEGYGVRLFEVSFSDSPA